MTGLSDVFTLAPAGVLRAAAWPLSCLDGFGDPALAGRGGDGVSFERDYQRTLSREREYLWSVTAEDAHFGKALALSSASAYARVMSAASCRRGLRNRAMRLAEHTLYRYLARAAGRATPHGLWAGVTEITFGQQTSVESTTPRYVFAPDLRAFQALVRGLAARPEYRSRSHWRLNPTFHREASGGWIFFARLADGRLCDRAVDWNEDLSRVLPILADVAPMSLDRLAREIIQRGAWARRSHGGLMNMLDTLADAGALVGGIDLPKKFETPWTALRRAADDLRASERGEWQTTIRKLEDHCDELSANGSAFSTEEFIARLARAGDCIASLAAAYRLPHAMTAAPVLRCDLHLPWRLTLDAKQKHRILHALRDYDSAWLRGTSPAGAERASMRAKLAQQLAEGMPIGAAARLAAETPRAATTSWPHPDEASEPEMAARIRAWEACLAAPGPAVTLTPRGTHPQTAACSPLGCLFVALSADFGINVRSASDLPTAASGRFSHMLENSRLNEWIRAELAATAAKTGISLVELQAPFENNPNILAGPSLLDYSLDPWGSNPQSLSLAGATMRSHAPSGRLVLELGETKKPWAVMTLGAADLRSRDPLSQLLLGTGFHEFPNRAQRALDIPTASELTQPQFTPRVHLPHGAVLRSRRTVLAADVPCLVRARGSERFRAWQRHAHELGWPERLHVSAGAGESMRIHRDSPLAVEALFKGIGSATPFVIVEEASPNDGLQVPGHGTHVAELALAFARHSSSTP